MKIEYCCGDFMEMVNDGMADLDVESKCISIQGWDIHFCPFCGEKIDIIVKLGGKVRE